jgi:hypothetical protein
MKIKDFDWFFICIVLLLVFAYFTIGINEELFLCISTSTFLFVMLNSIRDGVYRYIFSKQKELQKYSLYIFLLKKSCIKLLVNILKKQKQIYLFVLNSIFLVFFEKSYFYSVFRGKNG